jgi:hypothetical protein
VSVVCVQPHQINAVVVWSVLNYGTFYVFNDIYQNCLFY